MLRIGSLTLETPFIMGPMAGYTNLAFRLTVRRLGAGMVTTEMISAVGLALGQKKSLDYLRSHAEERPLAVQIFGSRPEAMARAAEIAAQAGADLIDVNMGCPVRKVVKTGAGAALLRDLIKAEEILSSLRKATPLPLTAKIRTGWTPDRPVACELAHVAEESGADAVTLHPRFATQGFSSPADWTWIGRVKERVRIPVIGNGDVFHPSHAIEMRRQTGCDGVMIGRGAMGNPWIFQQILCLEQGRPAVAPTLSERRTMIMEHFRLLSSGMGESRAAFAIRGLLLWYTKGLPHSGRFRGGISGIKNMETLMSNMDSYFSTLQEARA